ncbi:MAG: hypothetical protein PHQ66_01765 [Candidatus Nanoarchaeia archaeon]|nr:hypothetical protein [Candidatus Nanoarchaeia archaeon]MDD5357899.1 hypothetical protein [Candidatus Nanoarchaeia archaeon]MDD5588818.1 hypothetical protein [Candidatus Nanoarchaeia archaeon]
MENEIEKPWAVYGWFLGSMGIGKITRESESAVDILYHERQQYSPNCWNSKWVQRFETPVQAMKHYLETRIVTDDPFTHKEEIEIFLNSFPSEAPKLIFS